MKTLNLYTDHTKKSYRKPELNKLGKVEKMTKGIKGSTRLDGDNDMRT